MTYFYRQRHLGRFHTIDSYMWRHSVSLVSSLLCRGMCAIMVIVKSELLERDRGRSRKHWKEEQPGIFRVRQNYCYNVMAALVMNLNRCSKINIVNFSVI